jgi:hypothetical protein
MNIMHIVRFWKNKSIPQDKGGSFNLELYLRILEIKNTCIDLNTTLVKN